MRKGLILLIFALVLFMSPLFNPPLFALNDSSELEFQILLPSDIQLVEGEKFTIYYRNVLFQSADYLDSDYLISAQELLTGDVFGMPFINKHNWIYTPAVENRSRDMIVEFRLYDPKSGRVLTKKQVTFHIKPKAMAKPATIVTLGDSFTDSYGVAEALYNAFPAKSITMIGANKTSIPGVMDDAWGGYGYRWYMHEALGYKRADRASSDVKDGKTRNQFFNTYTQRFDFSFYMRKYNKDYVPSSKEGKHVDAVLSFAGLNDAIWITPEELQRALPQRKTDIIDMVNSIKRYDPNITILLNTITPQQKNDQFLINYGKDPAYPARAKYNQELWNRMILETFDTPELKARGIYVMATSANFNPQSDIRSEKGETVSVHPTKEGAANIASVAANTLSNLLMKE